MPDPLVSVLTPSFNQGRWLGDNLRSVAAQTYPDIEHIVMDERKEPAAASEGTRFAMAVAEWGMLLRGSRYAGSGSFDNVLSLAKGATGFDPGGYRKEFVEMVEKSKGFAGGRGIVEK